MSIRCVMALKWILLLAKLSCAFELSHEDNGWRPLPVDIALLHRNSVARSFNDRTFQRITNVGVTRVVPSQLYEKIPSASSTIKKLETKLINAFNSDGDNSDALVSVRKEIAETRKAKQLIIKENLKANEGGIIKTETKYEVTEKPESFGQIAADEINTYVYEVPEMQLLVPEQPLSKTITKKFLEILAKNNLNSNLNEGNYALSRTRNIKDRNIFVTLPLKVPFGYYVPNNISPDAILAMMLWYQDLYEHRLFGYSGKQQTFNNVNNDKPSASYKLYSDTDSSF